MRKKNVKDTYRRLANRVMREIASLPKVEDNRKVFDRLQKKLEKYIYIYQRYED